jgi:hypothetical protein
LTASGTDGRLGVKLIPERRSLAGRWFCVSVIALSASSCAGADGVPSLPGGGGAGLVE